MRGAGGRGVFGRRREDRPRRLDPLERLLVVVVEHGRAIRDVVVQMAREQVVVDLTARGVARQAAEAVERQFGEAGGPAQRDKVAPGRAALASRRPRADARAARGGSTPGARPTGAGRRRRRCAGGRWSPSRARSGCGCRARPRASSRPPSPRTGAPSPRGDASYTRSWPPATPQKNAAWKSSLTCGCVTSRSPGTSSPAPAKATQFRSSGSPGPRSSSSISKPSSRWSKTRRTSPQQSKQSSKLYGRACGPKSSRARRTPAGVMGSLRMAPAYQPVARGSKECSRMSPHFAASVLYTAEAWVLWATRFSG